MVHEPVNIHTLQSYISISLLWDYGHTMVCEMSSACRGECVATGGLCRPAHLNSTEIKVNSFS